MLQPLDHFQVAASRPRSGARRHRQRGVVLIVALIMLVIISLLATFSLRNAASTETLSGNVRTTELGTQTAEIALRYCEQGVDQYVAQLKTGATPTIAITLNPYDAAIFPRWNKKDSSQNLSYWDGPSSVTNAAVTLIDSSLVNSATATVTINRVPECMVEQVQVVASSTPPTTTTTSTYVITARGFGPEVAKPDPAVRARPVGTEVWLQSTVGYQ